MDALVVVARVARVRDQLVAFLTRGLDVRTAGQGALAVLVVDHRGVDQEAEEGEAEEGRVS